MCNNASASATRQHGLSARLKKTAAAGSTVLASALALAAPASADVQIRPDLRPGDVVRDGDVGAVVPQPGRSVRAIAVGADGRTETFGVTTRRDGTAVLSDLGVTFAPSGGADAAEGPADLITTPPGECEDGAYRRQLGFDGRPYKWKTTFNWWYRAVSTPSDVDTGAAREDVRRGVRNMVTSRNDCGMADEVSATQNFQGDTTTYPNFVFTGEHYLCGAPDGKNVVAFGPLHTNSIGATCVYGHDDGGAAYVIDEADSRLNKESYQWYAGTRPTLCAYPYAQRLNAEATMTMLAGYTYGLDAVNDDEHPNLTMSGASNGYCQESESTLGKGDVWGMRSLY